jgi:hypothetical protein
MSITAPTFKLIGNSMILGCLEVHILTTQETHLAYLSDRLCQKHSLLARSLVSVRTWCSSC